MLLFSKLRFVLLALSCVVLSIATAQDAYISGMVEEPTEDSVYLRFFSDAIARSEMTQAVKLDERRGFCIKIASEKPVSAWLRHNGDEIRVLIEEGDSVFVTFNGHDPASSARFYGRGAIKYNYFSDMSRLFDPWNDRVLTYNMTTNDSEAFRKLMDNVAQRKWSYYRSFMEENKDQLSEDFSMYAAQDIDYWWASSLLRYREIRSISLGAKEMISLPYHYYDFLDTLSISNGLALNNPYYCYFIDQYVTYCRDLGRNRYISKQSEAVTPSSSLNVYDSPGAALPVAIIDRPKGLHYTGKQAEKDYSLWYQVRTMEGQTYWLNAESVWLSEPSFNKNDPNKVVQNVEVTKLERKAFVTRDSIKMYDQAGGTKVLAYLQRNDELEYLNHKTQDLYEIKIGSEVFHDNFLKVRTNLGVTGWVINGGVVMQDKYVTTVEEREINDPYTVSPMGDLDRFFQGQVLHYMSARDFFYKCPTLPYEVARQRSELFRSITEYGEYASFVEEILDVPSNAAQGDYTRVTPPIKVEVSGVSLPNTRLMAMLSTKKSADEVINRRLMANSAKGDAIDYSAVEAMAKNVLPPGRQAPDFSLVDFNGNAFNLSSLRGKIVVLDFWASWCGPCLVQMSAHQRWLNSLPGNDVVQVYVSLDRNDTHWRNYIKGQSLQGIHLYDADRAISTLYKVQALPMYYIIDSRGYITSHSFTESHATLMEQINRMIIEK